MNSRTPYLPPPTLLKRIHSLISIQQKRQALTELHTYLAKRYKTYSQPLEQLLLLFTELCVDLRAARECKEGILQFKNVAQGTNPQSVENVVRHLIATAEAKVEEAAKEVTDREENEDLEAALTPEALLLASVQGADGKHRTEIQKLTPWLKYLWDTYRNILDILRNNSKLEVLYHATAKMAFEFCRKYDRKLETRRLCELLRSHLTNLAKYANQPHAINLSSTDSLHAFLDVHFVQLNAVSELEQWQEAFRSVEDIHGLLNLNRKPVKASWMINYYDKLTKLTEVSGQWVFHAAAWNRYQSVKSKEINTTKTASITVLSALAVPIVDMSQGRDGVDDTTSKNRLNVWCKLLNLTQAPTRCSLIKEARCKGLVQKAIPEVEQLYQMLEEKFHPLTICSEISPLLTFLSQQEDYKRYVEPLVTIVLTRMLQQLSLVYTTIHIKTLIDLAQFPAPYSLSPLDIEKFILIGCHNSELSIKVDHQRRCLKFEPKYLSKLTQNNETTSLTNGNQLAETPSDRLSHVLSRLGVRLAQAADLIQPERIKKRQQEKIDSNRLTKRQIPQEHKDHLMRKEIIERKKEIREELIIRQQKAEEHARNVKLQQEAEAERLRVIAEEKRRAELRMQRDLQEIAEKEKRQLAEELAKRVHGIKVEDMESLDKEKLVSIRVKQLDEEKKKQAATLKATAKRIDHLERALRIEELPLFKADYERQKTEDIKYANDTYEALVATTKRKHEADILLKSRLTRIKEQVDTYRDRIQVEQEEKFAVLRAEAEAELTKKREAKRIADLEREAAAKEAALREEEQRRIEEAEKESRRQEAERVAAENHAQEQQAKIAAEERLKAAMEVTRKQERIQQEAEQRREQERKQRQEEERRSQAAIDDASSGSWRPAGKPTARAPPPDARFDRQPSDTRFDRQNSDPRLDRQASDSRFGASSSRPGVYKPPQRERGSNDSLAFDRFAKTDSRDSLFSNGTDKSAEQQPWGRKTIDRDSSRKPSYQDKPKPPRDDEKKWR